MRARDARGHVELRGPTWWLRRRVLTPDPGTAELTPVQVRVPLGPKTELRSHGAARAAADQYLAMLEPERVAVGRTLLAVTYFEQFLRVHVPLMRPTSQQKYRGLIRQHLSPAAARRRLVDLDTAWLRDLVQTSSRTLARATVASIRGTALQLLRQARRDGFAARLIDPRDVRLPNNAIEPTRRHVKPDELERILQASPQPRRALWAVMGYGGLRIGEALGLTWEHVDFERHVLHVSQAAVRGQIAPLKTATSRADVPMIHELEEALSEYHGCAAYRGAVLPRQLLFSTRKGTPYSADYVRRHWLQPLLASLGLPRAGCHAFRHGLPARLFARGVAPDMIRKTMRHGTLAMTEKYLHSDTADLLRAVRDTPQKSVRGVQARPSAISGSQFSGVP
ncbi:MAG: tyrosine-type recombinase/integrase [Geminicoccaceae bacterium]